jgi:nucleoside-triphosphatase THEP1
VSVRQVMIYIITGSHRSGKTTFLMRTADYLMKENITAQGFLSVAVLHDRKTSRYDLFDLNENTFIPFIRREGENAWERIGPYYFIPQGLDHARKLILSSAKNSVLIIDEIGPLELKDRGLWPAVKQVIFSDRRIFIVAVRRSILKDFVNKVGKKEVKIFDIEDGNLSSWYTD